MKIVEKNSHYELVVYDSAVFQDYETILNYLIREMHLQEIDEIDDFDTHYQLLNYRDHVVVVYYNNFLGISIYLDDTTIDKNVQQNVLSEFLRVLEKKSE